jgi:hypothetical protein
MKWRTRTKHVPKAGDRRRRYRFAWFPVQTDDRISVWMERYHVIEQYVEGQHDYAGDNAPEWVTAETHIITHPIF